MKKTLFLSKNFMAYPIDFRKKVINYVENGGSMTEAAETYEVGKTTIY